MSQDDTILHQDDVEDVAVDVVTDEVTTVLAAASDDAAIADLAAPSATYVEAEALAARNKINLILALLRESGLLPSS